VLEYQRGMHELHWLQVHRLFSQIHAVELQVKSARVSLTDFLQIERVYIQPYGAFSNAGIDSIESVSACNS
jgi:hypothetical protein